jgi:integrase
MADVHNALFKQENSDYYFFHAEINGRENLICTCEIEVDKAKRFRDTFMESVVSKQNKDVRLRDYIQPYLSYERNPRVLRLASMNKKPGITHIKRQAAHLSKHVLTDIIADIPLTELTPGDCIDFQHRISKKLADKFNTINKVMLALKYVLSEAAVRGDIPVSPAARIGSIAYEKERKQIFSIEKTREIFNDPERFPSQKAFQVFRFTAFTGMRASEVLALHWEQLDGDILSIDRAWKTRHSLGLPKRDRTRVIPLPASVLDHLPERTSSKLVFHNREGERLGETWWRKNWRKIVYEYDEKGHPVRMVDAQEHVLPHGLRHAVNSYLIKEGIPLQYIQTYLGWSRTAGNAELPQSGLTKVQDGYTHIDVDDLRIVADTIDRLFSNPGNDHDNSNIVDFFDAKKIFGKNVF